MSKESKRISRRIGKAYPDVFRGTTVHSTVTQHASRQADGRTGQYRSSKSFAGTALTPKRGKKR